jgi:hypothetical protein
VVGPEGVYGDQQDVTGMPSGEIGRFALANSLASSLTNSLTTGRQGQSGGKDDQDDRR